MDNALYRIIDYPHAPVFDKSPHEVLALRVRHPSGSAWEVLDGVLTMTVGTAKTSYDLSALTIGQLADRLSADGFEVLAENSEIGSRSALLLLRGSNSQSNSNGDHLYAYTSLLWCLYAAYGGELDHAEYQIVQAIRQMVMTQAEGYWLDVWGTLYGISRPAGMADDQYQSMIPAEAFRLRVNAHAIEQAILDATGWDVRIEEPWKEIFTLDQSILSGPDRLYDGERYGYHLIRPTARQVIDWDKVIPIIERNRAAGVLICSRIVYHGAYIDASGMVEIATRNVRLSRAIDLYDDRALLDYMAIEDTSIKNYESRRRRTLRHVSGSVIVDEYAVTSAHSRTTRAYYSSVSYEQQFWDVPTSWNGTTETWRMNAYIQSAHTRSS